ncbi:hypothetical protein [Azospirillum melinis]
MSATLPRLVIGKTTMRKSRQRKTRIGDAKLLPLLFEDGSSHID